MEQLFGALTAPIVALLAIGGAIAGFFESYKLFRDIGQDETRGPQYIRRSLIGGFVFLAMLSPLMFLPDLSTAGQTCAWHVTTALLTAIFSWIALTSLLAIRIAPREIHVPRWILKPFGFADVGLLAIALVSGAYLSATHAGCFGL